MTRITMRRVVTRYQKDTQRYAATADQSMGEDINVQKDKLCSVQNATKWKKFGNPAIIINPFFS